MKTTASLIKASMGHLFLSPAFILIALASVTLLSKAHAVVPPPDGGYPNFNTAEGQNALFNLTTGAANTAVGWYSLFSNTTASFNTGVGAGTLLFNNGDQNTALGVAALLGNTTGSFNTATGVNALSSNTTGVSNTALGWGALLNNQTGNNNTAIGVRAGQDLTGNDNICIGSQVFGVAGENKTIRIGDNLTTGQPACYIGGIRGQSVDPGTASAVLIDSQSKLGNLNSARRFKQDVKPMDEASEAILALKPVAFHYKSDPKNTPCFGLIAEEVENVSPALVVHDKDGQLLSVRYDQVNAMLLNEFLKEHRKVEKLEAALEAVNARLKKQERQLQKVSAQIEMSRAAPHVASRD
jgi:hypothetical protein